MDMRMPTLIVILATALAAGSAVPAASAASAPTATPAADVHDVSIVMVDPPDADTDYTRAEALHSLAVVDAFYAHETAGALRFRVVSATDWIAPDEGFRCDDLDSALAFGKRASGFVPGPDRHLLVMTPGGAGCVYARGLETDSVRSGGEAQVSTTDPTTIAHELGHNLSLHHTSSVACAGRWDLGTASGLPADCARDEYGNVSDIMGGGFTFYPFSPVSLARLGVLRDEVVLACGGTRRITISTMSAGPDAQRVVGWRDPSHPGVSYSVEFRDAVDNSEYTALYPSPEAPDDDAPTGVEVQRTDPLDGDAGTVLSRPGDTSHAARRIRAGERVPLDDGMSVVVASIDSAAHRATVDVTVPCARPADGPDAGGRTGGDPVRAPATERGVDRAAVISEDRRS